MATDADDDSLRYFVSGSPSRGRLNENVLIWTPNFTDSGSDMVNFMVMDVRGGSTTTNVSITMINVNRPPVLEPLAELQVVAGEEATADLVVHDSDGNVATLTVSGHQATARLSGSRFSWSTTSAI